MDGPNASRSDLAGKIARLVEERGWNQEDFARIANLNRHTVREIIKNGGGRRLRNATVSQCAAALGLHVNELRDLPLERLLPRMHGKKQPEDEGGLKLLLHRATAPDLLAWLERNPDRVVYMLKKSRAKLFVMERGFVQLAAEVKAQYPSLPIVFVDGTPPDSRVFSKIDWQRHLQKAETTFPEVAVKPGDAFQMLPAFASAGRCTWSVPTVSMLPSTTPRHSASRSAGARSGGLTLPRLPSGEVSSNSR